MVTVQLSTERDVRTAYHLIEPTVVALVGKSAFSVSMVGLSTTTAVIVKALV